MELIEVIDLYLKHGKYHFMNLELKISHLCGEQNSISLDFIRKYPDKWNVYITKGKQPWIQAVGNVTYVISKGKGCTQSMTNALVGILDETKNKSMIISKLRNEFQKATGMGFSSCDASGSGLLQFCLKHKEFQVDIAKNKKNDNSIIRLRKT
jgi:hypothetical protein